MEKHTEIKNRAKKRILARKAFYAHALIYAACVPLLIAINLITLPEFWWWVFPVFGWGFLVTVHFIINYFLVGAHSAKWEQEELQAEIDRLKREDFETLDLDDDIDFSQKENIDSDWDEGEFV